MQSLYARGACLLVPCLLTSGVVHRSVLGDKPTSSHSIREMLSITPPHKLYCVRLPALQGYFIEPLVPPLVLHCPVTPDIRVSPTQDCQSTSGKQCQAQPFMQPRTQPPPPSRRNAHQVCLSWMSACLFVCWDFQLRVGGVYHTVSKNDSMVNRVRWHLAVVLYIILMYCSGHDKARA